MQRYYETPDLHVIQIDTEYIVVTSGGKLITDTGTGQTETNYNDWIQGEGEW